MRSIDQFAQLRGKALREKALLRTRQPVTRRGTRILRDGQEYLSFACNDYLGLSQHPSVIAAGKAALEDYGAGAGASRLVTGDHPFYEPLEAKLAALKGTEAALVFGSGYLTNLGVIPALVGKGDLIIADKLVHACILDGAQLSGATVKRFRHNDVAHATEILVKERANYQHALIVTDHVFSMDGDRAPLAALSKLANTHDAWLMADDAHGIGLIHNHAELGVDVWMGTLSKAAGAYGGYVAASQPVIDYLFSSARSFMFSTGLPPATCASALAALELIEREPERGQRTLALAQRVTDALGLPPAQSAIVPLIVGEAEAAIAASEALKAQGIWVTAIRPPTVSPGTARLRLAFSAAHTDDEIHQLITAIKKAGIA